MQDEEGRVARASGEVVDGDVLIMFAVELNTSNQLAFAREKENGTYHSRMMLQRPRYPPAQNGVEARVEDTAEGAETRVESRAHVAHAPEIGVRGRAGEGEGVGAKGDDIFIFFL